MFDILYSINYFDLFLPVTEYNYFGSYVFPALLKFYKRKFNSIFHFSILTWNNSFISFFKNIISLFFKYSKYKRRGNKWYKKKNIFITKSIRKSKKAFQMWFNRRNRIRKSRRKWINRITLGIKNNVRWLYDSSRL